ncbi:MAG: trigger factor [Saprospiraceae bacterium]
MYPPLSPFNYSNTQITMEVSVEKLEGIGRKLSISVAAEEFDKHINVELNKFKGNAKIPGFRKGKVPAKMLEQQFGGQAARNAMDTLINQYYPQALQQEELNAASLINITPTQVERNKPFTFEVEIEVFPEIAAPSLKEVEISQADVAVTDADIDQTLESIRERNVVYAEADKAAEDSDQVTVDFAGSIDGVPFAGGEMKDAQIVLGAGQFLPDFEEGVMGAKKGDERNVQVSFPEDYQSQEVAGKTAEFVITVNRVSKGSLPELDDTFALGMGVTDGLDAMKTEVRKGLDRELSQKLRSDVRNQVMAALADTADFPLPQSMVNEEIERAMEQITKQLESQGMPAKDFVKRENYEEESKKRVKLGLLVREVVEAEKIELDNDLMKQRITEMAGSYSEPEAYVQHVMNDEAQRNQIGGVILEEQVVAKLLETANIKKVKQSYEDFMKND